VEIGQLVQLGDVVPGRLRQPRARIVHLIVFVQHLSIPTDHSMLQSLSQYAPQLFTACSSLSQHAPVFHSMLQSFTACSSLSQHAPVFHSMLQSLSQYAPQLFTATA